MRELQKDIGDWQRDNFKQANVPSLLKHLEREMSELKDVGTKFVAHCGKPDGSFDMSREEYTVDHLDMLLEFRHELADVIILTIALADLLNVDLEKSVIDKMVINKARKWKEPDADGVVEHIKETE